MKLAHSSHYAAAEIHRRSRTIGSRQTVELVYTEGADAGLGMDGLVDSGNILHHMSSIGRPVKALRFSGTGEVHIL